MEEGFIKCEFCNGRGIIEVIRGVDRLKSASAYLCPYCGNTGVIDWVTAIIKGRRCGCILSYADFNDWERKIEDNGYVTLKFKGDLLDKE